MKSNQRGFTFIELIISLTILAFISLFVAESIGSAGRNKKKIQAELDRDTSVRDAFYVISRDLWFAFNYRDINVELFNQAQKERQKRSAKKATKKTTDDKTGEDKTGDEAKPDTSTTITDKNDATNPFEKQDEKKYELKEERILTQFRGDADELHFTTLSQSRSLRDQAISDQAEVGYFLKQCRNRIKQDAQSNCLWRRTSPVLDDKVEEGGNETPLLENVSQLKFRYIGPSNSEEPEWRDDWRSGEGADDFTRGKFPWAVEVSVEVLDKNKEKDKPLAMTVVAQLRFPNNPDPKAAEADQEPTTDQRAVEGTR